MGRVERNNKGFYRTTGTLPTPRSEEGGVSGYRAKERAVWREPSDRGSDLGPEAIRSGGPKG